MTAKKNDNKDELKKSKEGLSSKKDKAKPDELNLLQDKYNETYESLLRSKSEVQNINQNAFLLGSSYSAEGRIAAQYIVKHLGLDSIAVVAPANKKTEIQIDAFINEVDRLGGNVVATEWYSGEPKNLRRQFKYLRKVGFELDAKEKIFDEALGMELDSIDALFDVSADEIYHALEISNKIRAFESV